MNKESNRLCMPGFDTFTCIADRCSFTCCQQWKISVDDKTEALWNKKGRGNQIKTVDESRVIRLNQEKVCPYLTERKLCGLVISEGEEAIPHTCRIFPRQVHTFKTHSEEALVTCCPEVLEKMLTMNKEDWDFPAFAEKGILIKIRNDIMRLLMEADEEIETTLQVVFYLILDLVNREKKIRRSGKYEEKLSGFWKADLSEWDDVLRAVKGVPCEIYDSIAESNELFLDVAVNYREEKLYEEILGPLWKAAQEMEEGEIDESVIASYRSFQKYMKKYDRFFRQYIVSEIFADALLPDSDLKDLAVMLQWISMEYSLMQHALFLFYRNQEEKLSWEEMRLVMVVLARMTGYDLGDIYAYFENSFDDVIWEWGYLNLILPI